MFCSYIDFSKAFVRIDRALLWSKLTKLGLHGRVLSVLKSLYTNVQCCVKVNGTCTEYFESNCGLKQGCLLSPLLFSLYINDCVCYINGLQKGILCDNDNVSALLYADDMVLLSDNAADLQVQLNALSDWCQQWGLSINSAKSKIVHFRPQAKPQSDFQFSCNNHTLDYTDRYKYLGIWLTEHLDLSVTAAEVARSAHRALGVIICKR